MRRAAPIASVKHRTASAQRLGACWDLEIRCGIGQHAPAILAWLPIGSVLHEIACAICTLRNPVPGAWVVRRFDAATWQLTPLQWPRDPDRVARGVPFAPGLPIGFVELLCAPPEVASILESL